MILNVNQEPISALKEKRNAPIWMLEADWEIQSADGFVIVLSEYNCGIPPALVSMINHFASESYRHRPCSVVAYSKGNII